MHGFTVTCVKCGIDAPELGDGGYLGTPSVSPDPKSYRHRESDRDLTFGFFYEPLAAMGLCTDELEAMRLFLDTHRGHDVVLYGEAQDDASLPRGLRSVLKRRAAREEAGEDDPAEGPAAALPAGEFLVGRYGITCSECRAECEAGEPASLRRFEPHALDPAAVDLMLERWKRAPDGGWNAGLAPPIDPYGAFMRELLEFLGKHREHSQEVRLRVDTARPLAPRAAWPRPEGAELRLERIKALKLAGHADRISDVVAGDCGVFLSARLARIHALDPADFSERWAIRAEMFGVTFVASETLVVENVSSAALRGLDPATGKTLWEAKVPLGTQLHGQDLLVRGDAEALVVDARNGRTKKRIALPWPEGVGRLLGGVLLRHQQSEDTLAAFDLEAREVLWERKCPLSKAQQDDAAPRILGGSAEAGVFVYGRSPVLFGLDLRKGETLWELKASLLSVGLLRNVALVEFTARDGTPDPFGARATANCVELSSGRIRWSRLCSDYGWPVSMRGAHVLGDDFVLGTTKSVVVLSARDGSVVLKHEKSQGAFLGGSWLQYVFLCGERGRFDVLRASVATGDEPAEPKKRRNRSRP